MERANALEVQADSTHDVLIRRQALVDHIGVVDDVATEEQAPNDGVDDVESTAERDEDAHEARHDCAVRVLGTVTFDERGNIPSAMRVPKRKGPIPEKSYWILVAMRVVSGGRRERY